MQQQQTQTQHHSRPKRWDIFLHIGKTFKLIGALVTDRRIALWRKVLFFACIAALLAVLFFPDFFDEVLLSAILPVVGTILGVPIDAGFDWIAFALIAVSLLRLFPAELLAEHYERIFRHKSQIVTP